MILPPVGKTIGCNRVVGGAKLIGALFLVGNLNVNTFTVYYDSSIAASIETGGTGQINRDSWDEINTSW